MGARVLPELCWADYATWANKCAPLAYAAWLMTWDGTKHAEYACYAPFDHKGPHDWRRVPLDEMQRRYCFHRLASIYIKGDSR